MKNKLKLLLAIILALLGPIFHHATEKDIQNPDCQEPESNFNYFSNSDYSTSGASFSDINGQG